MTSDFTVVSGNANFVTYLLTFCKYLSAKWSEIDKEAKQKYVNRANDPKNNLTLKHKQCKVGY